MTTTGRPWFGPDCLDALQQVVRGIGDLQKLLGCDLRRAGVVFVGELDGCALEALASKFLPKLKPSITSSPCCRGGLPRAGLILDRGSIAPDDCFRIQVSMSAREKRQVPTLKAGIFLAAASR